MSSGGILTPPGDQCRGGPQTGAAPAPASGRSPKGMDFLFLDDSRQAQGARAGVGDLLGYGGFIIAADRLLDFTRSIETIVKRVGIPDGQQFKWSPGKNEQHFKAMVTGDARRSFYLDVASELRRFGAEGLVVVEDLGCKPARAKSESRDLDVLAMLLERAERRARMLDRALTIVCATPGGGPGEQTSILNALDRLQRGGTEYVTFGQTVGCTQAPTRHLAALQVADFMVSCVVSRIAGERHYSPTLFEALRPLLRSEGGVSGGYGLKIHPDFKYMNLYYWLLGDRWITKGAQVVTLPVPSLKYAKDSGEVIQPYWGVSLEAG